MVTKQLQAPEIEKQQFFCTEDHLLLVKSHIIVKPDGSFPLGMLILIRLRTFVSIFNFENKT